MSSTLSDVLLRLERSRADLRSAVDSVPPHLRDRSPGANRWSVAGVLEHLALVDEGYTAIVVGRVAEARAAALPDGEVGALELPPAVATMLADRTARRIAPERLHPSGLSWEAAWDRAAAARAAFRDVIADAKDLALSRVIHDHPRFGSLNLYQWGGFLAAHESRHAAQVREIGSALGEGASSSG